MKTTILCRTAQRALSTTISALSKHRAFSTPSQLITHRLTRQSLPASYFPKRFASNEPIDAPASADQPDSASIDKAVEAASAAEPPSAAETTDDVSESSGASVNHASISESESVAAETAAQAAARSISAHGSPRLAYEAPVLTNSVFVGNLPFDVTEADLLSAFEPIGPIESAKILVDPQGLSKGIGFVNFGSVDQAKKAIEEFNGQELNGRTITIQPSRGKRNSDAGVTRRRKQTRPTDTLFIGNMPYQMSDQEINKLFRGLNNVVDVRVAIDRQTGRPRGFAHAEFVDVASAQAARAQLEGKKFHDREIRLDYSFSVKKEDTKPPTTGEEGVGP